MKKRFKVFLLYAYSDQDLLNKLVNHLVLLEREELISLWGNGAISPGTERDSTIQGHLYTADLILLLVSSDFLASDDCIQGMEIAMKRYRAGGAHAIPVLLRPVAWQMTPFGILQALPSNNKPVTTWQNRDEACLDITEGIRVVIGELVPLPQIDTTLLMVLNYQKNLCRENNKPFFTPHMLVPLLNLSPSWIKRALEDWRSGFARDFQTRLERYISDILPRYPGSFSGFHWEEREDVQKARQIARKEGSDTVMEKHLFLGILETESKTQQALKNALGEKDFGQLVDFIRSRPDQSPGTPGTEDIF